MKKNKELVHVRVIRHLPQGLSVELDNGERGIIRVREISQDKQAAANWKSDYPIGWDGYAFSIPARRGEEAREFSLRLVESDPWDDFFNGFDKNEVFEGVVTGVYDYGAFIEIESGVSGLLHKSQIPADIQTPVLDLFWHGDKVFVVIREVDQTERQINLGLAPANTIPSETASVTRAMPIVRHEAEVLPDIEIPRRHILVVEDEIVQSDAVCSWLRELGQSVDAVYSAEEAIAFLQKTQPDIILVDVGLPLMSGPDLARYILKNYPKVQVVNATDWVRANEIKGALDELQMLGGKLLYKPLLPDDLAAYLLHEQDQRFEMSAQADELPLSNIPKMDVEKSIHTLLAMYRIFFGVEQVFLFSLDPAHRRIHVVERAGDGMVNKAGVAQLIYSPVRDVAEDRKIVVANEIAERERKRFQYLIEFSPATVSCIGVPVPAREMTKYALFAFDRRAKQFSEERQMYAQGMALAIGAALDQHTMRGRSALMQRSALIGNLASGMMHEINNLVSPLIYGADNIKRHLARIEKKSEKPNYDGVNSEILNIEQDVRQIVNTTRAFSKIATKPKTETLRVDEIINDTLLLLREIGKRAHVRLEFKAPDKLMIVRNQSVILEQIFLNIVLNAIQQIAENRIGGMGWVNLDMQLINKPQGALCRVLVQDNGPGIHTALREKIFEMGFSTRLDGSGIGLYVSRNLMEEIGGRIYVNDSHILHGSVFALEFPINL